MKHETRGISEEEPVAPAPQPEDGPDARAAEGPKHPGLRAIAALQRHLHLVGSFVVLLIFVAAIFLLYRELKHFHYHELRESLRETSAIRIAAALALTALNYMVLVGYDWLAVRYVGHKLSLGRIAMASFIGYVSSFNFGALLGGTSVRYRLYSAWGFSAVEIVELVTFLSLSFWIGILALAGIAFLVEPPLPENFVLPMTELWPLGLLLLGITCAYLALVTFYRRPIRIFGWKLPLPSLKIALLQIAISAADLAVAAAILYVLLPAGMGIGYPKFLGFYLVAAAAVIFTHVPGGLGVLELVVLTLLAPNDPSGVVASLLLFRGVYYLLPLALAAILLIGHELHLRREAVGRMADFLDDLAPVVIPRLLAFLVFICGAILLFSGALPMAQDRIARFPNLLSLPVIEVSHFLSSLMGVVLLILAWGLQHRLNAAFAWTSLVLGLTILFSLLRGLDYELALILLGMLVVLLSSREHFYRKGALFSEPLTPEWLASAVVVVLCAGWLGLFAHKHLAYSGDLWWQFSLQDDAPRFLRAATGMAAVLCALAAAAFLRSRGPRPTSLEGSEEGTIRRIVAASRESRANLALLGDKTFLVNDEKTALLMYAISGRSWVALGDPIGPPPARRELLWQFCELCDTRESWPVLYDVSEENIPIYVDLGLTLTKLGEEARVALTRFSLEGAHWQPLRHLRDRLIGDHYSVEVILPRDATKAIDDLKQVSDAWLSRRGLHEMHFSHGRFDEAWLRQCHAGLARQNGQIIGFASLLTSAEKEEICVDLLRFRPDAPEGVSDLLRIELMLWAQQQGYSWFNLGVAPLSGPEDRTLAPIGDGLDRLMFPHGECLEPLPGLRERLQPFAPQWRPKYLASPGNLALPRILADVATLISGQRNPDTGPSHFQSGGRGGRNSSLPKSPR